MANEMNEIKIDAEVERARVAAVSDRNMNHSVHISLSKDERASHSSDSSVMMTIDG